MGHSFFQALGVSDDLIPHHREIVIEMRPRVLGCAQQYVAHVERFLFAEILAAANRFDAVTFESISDSPDVLSQRDGGCA